MGLSLPIRARHLRRAADPGPQSPNPIHPTVTIRFVLPDAQIFVQLQTVIKGFHKKVGGAHVA